MAKAAVGILRNLLGETRVKTAKSAFIVRPPDVDLLCRTVQVLAGLGVTVTTQAGGPVSGGTIDLSDLNGIFEMNEADGYVTVEAGCTWATLLEALKARGLRVQAVGPFADRTTQIGAAVDSGEVSDILGLDVVLADGSLVETGAAAAEGRHPFFRQFGPDLTGLFVGDCGAFGVKARVSLPLVPLPAADDFLSFAFERFEDVAEAHAVLARENIAADHWSIGPDGNDRLAAVFPFLEGLAFIRSTPKAARTLVDGHRPGIRGGFSLHAVVEADSARDAERKRDHVRRLLLPLAMKELPNTLPKALRAAPEGLRRWLQAAGENRRAAHGIFPLSQAAAMAAITDEYFVRHREILAKHGFSVFYLTHIASGRGFVLETTLSWKKTRTKAAAAAETLQRDLAGLWDTFGASHFDMARYAYGESLSSAARALTAAVKAALDPKGLMNPGGLCVIAGTKGPKAKSRFAEFPQNLLD